VGVREWRCFQSLRSSARVNDSSGKYAYLAECGKSVLNEKIVEKSGMFLAVK
jgi:hypothetical protein